MRLKPVTDKILDLQILIRETNLGLLAAGFSYFSLISFIPLFAVILALGKAAGSLSYLILKKLF